jgi:hypothetical protein
VLNSTWGALERYNFEYSQNDLLRIISKPNERQKHRSNSSISNLYRLHECNLFNNMGTYPLVKEWGQLPLVTGLYRGGLSNSGILWSLLNCHVTIELRHFLNYNELSRTFWVRSSWATAYFLHIKMLHKFLHSLQLHFLLFILTSFWIKGDHFDN